MCAIRGQRKDAGFAKGKHSNVVGTFIDNAFEVMIASLARNCESL